MGEPLGVGWSDDAGEEAPSDSLADHAGAGSGVDEATECAPAWP